MNGRRFGPVLAALLAAAAAGAGPARADGLPVVNVDAGPTGVATVDGSTRYVVFGTPSGSVVARLAGGHVDRWRYLRARLTIPAVAFDGTPDGLSRDGRTLVLIRPRDGFPQPRTRLALLDAQRLTVERSLELRGDFSFDAVSPDGLTVYLIEYLAPDNPARYAVRAYDVHAGRLLDAPVIDPNEPDEQMNGYPVTRTTSRDGRWAYTLYDGLGEHPFVHALDTRNRSARCIDLDALAGRRDLGTMKLRLDPRGHALTVGSRGRAAAVVDTRSFRVSEPVARTGAAAASTGGNGWRIAVAVGVAGAVAFLGVSAAVAGRRRRRAAA
jgi:hypothetical protein